MTKTTTNDWRLELLGSIVKLNQSSDEESPSIEVPTLQAVDKDSYDYIAILFVANYCPHCKLFAPHVVASAAAFEAKKCKVIVCTNDRDEENFVASCTKTRGLDILPYDIIRTQRLRDLFGLQTIPALIILENDNFNETAPRVVTNARNVLEQDPELAAFPWDPKAEKASMSGWDRLIISGIHGKWYHLGHRNVSVTHPETMYMDEHSVRIRAGLLNSITWVALMNIFFFKDQTLVHILFPLVAFEFLSSGILGMTPIAPLGTIATALSILLHPEPLWKPASPKRFAWAIGLALATTCFMCFAFRDALGSSYRYAVASVVFTCNIFTWLESSAGFCFGCFVYNTYLVPYFGMEECSDCKI